MQTLNTTTLMSGYNEEDIIQHLQDPSKKREAFGKLVEHYSQTVYWQIRRIVISHDDADDVLQNTFIKAWRNIGTFRGDSKISTWLYKIAFNESLTYINNRRQTIPIDTEAENLSEELMSDPYFDGDQAQALLQEAISALPDKQRLVFTLKYFQEMKYEEISEMLGTSVGALKATYHHAVKKVEHFLSQRELN